MNSLETLELLRSRRSVRAFTDEPVAREVLVRLLEAATCAPSATNRQPWRFAVVTSRELRAAIATAVRQRTALITETVRRARHVDEPGDYLEYFFRPLESAQALVVAQYRTGPDLLAELIQSAGGDPATLLGQPMHLEVSATSAALMSLLLQARAEGLGACWLSGPLVARDDLARLLGIAPPWQILALVALGHPAGPPHATARKPLSQVATWFEDAGTGTSDRPMEERE